MTQSMHSPSARDQEMERGLSSATVTLFGSRLANLCAEPCNPSVVRTSREVFLGTKVLCTLASRESSHAPSMLRNFYH